jgi:hypothetical protein
MQQGMKTFFLDALKGQITSAKQLFAELLTFVQNIVADIASRLVSAGIVKALPSLFPADPNANNDLSGTPSGLVPIKAQYGASFTVPGSGGPDSQFLQLFATPGEKVTIETPEQQARSGGQVVVNVYNQTPAQVQTQSRTGPGGESIVELVIKQVDQALAGGSFDRSLAINFGLRRQGFAR